MKKLNISLLLCFSGIFIVQGATLKNKKEVFYPQDSICEKPQKMPEYKGGLTALYEFLSEEINYPREARKNDIDGLVVVSFVIDKDGSVVSVVIKESVDPSLDKEALRVVKSIPRWYPGEQDGKKVRTRMTLPINFVIKE